MTLPLYASLERLDVRLIEAATDLYSSAFTAFRKVTFPLVAYQEWSREPCSPSFRQPVTQ